MTDLTEQWKKGELPDGHYYCKLILNNMKPSVERCKAHCIPMGVSADKGEEVLAPVPSYEEWIEYQELDEDNKRNALLAIRFSIEAEILKELLKQSRIYVKIETEDYDDRTVSKADKEEAKKLLTKIDEALK